MHSPYVGKKIITKLIVTRHISLFDCSFISSILMYRPWMSSKGGNGRKVPLVEHVPTRHSCG